MLCISAREHSQRNGSIQITKRSQTNSSRLHEKHPPDLPNKGGPHFHTVFSILTSSRLLQELMIKRELAKDPKLVNESWDRFLPKFRKRHLKTSEKTARKREAEEQKSEARKAAGLDPEVEKQKDKKKKVYTPFPPAQLPRKVSRSFL